MARVLVAEDDFEMRAMVVEALRKDGHEVTEVSDGMALVGKIVADCARSAARLDLIVSDLRMPGCNAFQALEWMRALGSHARFVLMTAFGDDDVRRRAHDLGAVLFDKPFSLEALREEVKRPAVGLGPPPPSET